MRVSSRQPRPEPHGVIFLPLGRTLGGLRFDWQQVAFRDGTNLGINGLVSADRNNKATLLLTTPRCTIKSSAKDLSLRIVKLQYTSNTPREGQYRSDAIQSPRAYSYTTTMSQG